MADEQLSRRGFLGLRFGGGTSRLRWMADDAAAGPASEPDKRAHPMVAKVVKVQCLAWGNSTCTTCHERCPTRAIDLQQERPVVDVAKCDGCGICRDVCPSPAKGILLLPKIV